MALSTFQDTATLNVRRNTKETSMGSCWLSMMPSSWSLGCIAHAIVSHDTALRNPLALLCSELG